MNCIGIDLGGTNIKGALVSAEGKILREHAVETRVDLGPEAVAARIGQASAVPARWMTRAASSALRRI